MVPTCAPDGKETDPRAATRAPVLSTHAIPNPDTHTRPPSEALTDVRVFGAGPSAYSDSEGPPTIRVPVHRPTAAVNVPGVSAPPAATPPPASDLKFSCSAWSSADDDAPVGRRNPRVGDTLLGFKLVGELGRGAFARVFLAEQEALANRPVALKVTSRPTREAQRLARLQHTNVVPVYSVHDAEAAQVICMPFLGRTTIADLIRAYRADHPSRHSGRKSTSAARAGGTTALDSKNKGSKTADSKGNTGAHRAPIWTWATEEPPPIVGDPVAVLQLLAQLADGLAHAHERGILHLDLKPANVLLADTGEPMLLDFNLSFDATAPDRELVGGTMPYMAIEQLIDMRNRGQGQIDGRTDLYSLGVMAYEMLAGTVPFPTSTKAIRDIDGQVAARRKGPAPLRERNPDVTPAIEAIVMKLLAPDPEDRYQSALDLKTDIDRHLADLPLQFAGEPSLRERFGKWRRRNPRAPYVLAVAAALASALGAGWFAYDRAEGKARADEENARVAAVLQAEGARSGLDVTRLDLVLPDDAKARARGTKRATELLATYGLPGDTDWYKQPDVRRLSEAERTALAGDLGELMILLARAKWQEAGALPEDERGVLGAEAWKLVTAARGCFADGAAPPALDRLAALVARAAGERFDPPAEAADRKPNARDLFLDAAFALNRGQYVDAARALDRALTAKPDHAAAQFCLAYCRQQAGQFQGALERYDVARTMLPNDPRPASQRAVIYSRNQRHEETEAEYTKALALDPDDFNPYRYRALARLRLGTPEKLAGAEADLTAALERGAPALSVHLVRGQVRTARGDKDGAAADAAAAKTFEVKTEADFIVRGWTKINSDPKAARADFEKALELNPCSLLALQNLVHVLADKLKDNEAALGVATKEAELYPEFGPALANRAVILARLGRRKDAHDEIAKARQLSVDDPQVTYQAAAVFALTSVTHGPKQADALDPLNFALLSAARGADHAKALDLLQKAVDRGYRNVHGMATDTDLDSLRKTRDYQDIANAAATLAKQRAKD